MEYGVVGDLYRCHCSSAIPSNVCTTCQRCLPVHYGVRASCFDLFSINSLTILLSPPLPVPLFPSRPLVATCRKEVKVGIGAKLTTSSPPAQGEPIAVKALGRKRTRLQRWLRTPPRSQESSAKVDQGWPASPPDAHSTTTCKCLPFLHRTLLLHSCTSRSSQFHHPSPISTTHTVFISNAPSGSLIRP